MNYEKLQNHTFIAIYSHQILIICLNFPHLPGAKAQDNCEFASLRKFCQVTWWYIGACMIASSHSHLTIPRSQNSMITMQCVFAVATPMSRANVLVGMVPLQSVQV